MSEVQLSVDSSVLSTPLPAHLEALWEKLHPTGKLPLAESWQAWCRSLKKQPATSVTSLLKGGKSDSLLWGLPAELLSGELPELTKQLAKAAAGKKKALAWAAETLPNWLDESAGRQPTLTLAIECVAWCHALPQLAAHTPPETWLELLAQLRELSQQAAALDMAGSPLLHQLLDGECAVALGFAFPKNKFLRKQAINGRKALAAGMLELLDGEGLPHATHLAQHRAMIACWTRGGAMCQQLGEPLLIHETAAAYAWAVQQMLRLTAGDGHQLLDPHHHSLSRSFVQAAVALTADSECRAVARLGGYLAKKKAGNRTALNAPEPGTESEWAGVGILRSDWTRQAATLLTLHAEHELSHELCLGSETVFSGSGNPTIEVDGQSLTPTESWQQNCWQADHDVDYFELEAKLTGGWTLQRQLMLARSDCFFLLCDALLPPADDRKQHQILYRNHLSLDPTWSFNPCSETAEGTLLNAAGKQRALVLPLALPEWRSGAPRGKLSTNAAGELVLEQHHTGSRLFAPLFFDLYSRRMRKQLTWRQLTVADQLEIQSPDVAVGYRVQLGREQWLIYRSLARPGNRTVLGHNLTTEFLVARFDDGETDGLLEIV